MSFVQRIIFADSQMRAARPEYVQYSNLFLFSIFIFIFGYATYFFSRQDVSRVFSASSQQEVMAPELVQLKAQLVASFTPIKAMGDFQVEENAGRLKLQFSTFDMFQAGQADFNPDQEAGVKNLALFIHENDPKADIEIEGYTDDTNVLKNKGIFLSNWELSAARAAAMIHVFEGAGFRADQLKIAGRGASRPLLANRTPEGQPIYENQVRNRRVIIHIGKSL